MNVLWVGLLAAFGSGCALVEEIEGEFYDEPIECTGFTLVGTYWSYDIRALRLLENPHLLDYQSAALKNAREAAAPYAQPTAHAAVDLREFLMHSRNESPHRIVLEQNMGFWVHHFKPHVEVLVNAVRATPLQP